MKESGDYLIQYKDDEEDWISVQDDDDLALAYEFAQLNSKSMLKLCIIKNDQKMQSNSTATTTIPKLGKREASKVDSSDSDDEHHIKKMIESQIKDQTDVLLKSFRSMKIEQSQPKKEDMSNQIDSASRAPSDLNESMYPNEQHTSVCCDGCNVNPIIGVRYKCSICKDFDYCQKCEESKDHPHAFLKIKKAGTAPKTIFTVIDERMENVKPDIDLDVDINDSESLLKSFFG